MRFNPFEKRGTKICDSFRNWTEMNPRPYDKLRTNPYTKTRVILANGTEFEATWFKHQLLRQCSNREIRKEITLLRRIEQEQQKVLAVLKPTNESMLEHAIAYEQLAIDLTAMLAKREKNSYVRETLNFALLEDFDHLYRFANLLAMEGGTSAERLVGRFTEIMPGRPTVSEHRFPYDDVRRYTNFKKADILTKIQTMIITAAEQQTMNYYMNAATLYNGELGRRMFQEIAMIEEQHVTHYGSLLDPNSTWLEEELMHEYVEAYLYYSFILDETDEHIKRIWIRNLEEEIGHLHVAAELLEKYEHKSWREVLGTDGTFPEPLRLGSNKGYIRKVLENTVTNTSNLEEYVDISTLPLDHRFFFLQKKRNGEINTVPTHVVIEKYITRNGSDYRYEDAPSPVRELRDRRCDNTTLGREPKCFTPRQTLEFISRDNIPGEIICSDIAGGESCGRPRGSERVSDENYTEPYSRNNSDNFSERYNESCNSNRVSDINNISDDVLSVKCTSGYDATSGYNTNNFETVSGDDCNGCGVENRMLGSDRDMNFNPIFNDRMSQGNTEGVYYNDEFDNK